MRSWQMANAYAPLTPSLLFLFLFVQDLPDVKGDKKYNISTFASKRGVKFTARAASAVLAVNYVSAIVEGALSPGKREERGRGRETGR